MKTATPIASLGTEMWIVRQLCGGVFQGTHAIFFGATDAKLRRERIRKKILELGVADQIAGKIRGRGETWRKLFERVYGVPLDESPTLELNLSSPTATHAGENAA